MSTDAGDLLLAVALQPEPLRRISGFWRRTCAFLIDSAILAIPEFALGAFFSDFFSYANGWAAVVGLSIQVLYFGILSSSEVGGTVGQRLTDIQVVHRSGEPLPVGRSIWRYFILFAPFLLVTPAFRSVVAATVYSIAVGTVQAMIIYLYIFNVGTRQSLHDLAVSAFVLNRDPAGRFEAPRFWRGHLVIFGGLGVAVLLACLFLFQNFRGTLGELVPIREAVLNSGGVHDAGVFMQWNSRNGVKTAGIQVNVIYKERPEDYDQAAKNIAEIVFQTDPRMRDKDYLAVTFEEGFRVGLASFTRTRVVRHAPDEW